MSDDLKIVVDTREQQPYTFGEIETVKKALPAGDYSLAGFELEVAVERKSLQDFISTVIHNRERFRQELTKLTNYRHACITVEASAEDIREQRYTGNAHPESIIGSAIAITVKWHIPVFLNINRQESCEFTRRYLKMAGDNLTRLASDQTDEKGTRHNGEKKKVSDKKRRHES